MNGKGEATLQEKLRRSLLAELALIKPEHLETFWQTLGWKPNPVEMASDQSPTGTLLCSRPGTLLTQASRSVNPFAWLLARIAPADWIKHCRRSQMPWAVRFWLAAASWTLAMWRLSERLHGRRDTYVRLQKTAKANAEQALDAALDYHCAQVGHMPQEQRREFIAALPPSYREFKKAISENQRRRLRDVEHQGSKVLLNPAKDRPLERLLVTGWLNLRIEDPQTGNIALLPGLCFFSDQALCDIAELFNFRFEDVGVFRKMRQRLGLVQAGAQVHLIANVKRSGGTLSFVNDQGTVFTTSGLSWPGR